MSYQKGLVATLAELEEFYKGENVDSTMIELMNQQNDVLTDIPWMESNMSDGHLTRIRTGLPAVYWRRLYRGTPPSKGQFAQIKEGVGMLEGRMELDVKELELYGDRAKSFRLSEAKGFMEAMRQKVARTLFYGDHSSNADEFNGLAQRYPSLNTPNVVNAGGTGAHLTSMYLVAWGSESVHGLYPKGAGNAGLTKKELGERTVTDDDGNKFEAMVDLFSWNCGLTVRDWRAVVRVCNIDTTKLMLSRDKTGYVDLQKLTIQAKNLMPEQFRNKAIWYANTDVINALEYQAIDSHGVQLHYGEWFGAKAVPSIHGRPIRQVDAISSTEAVVA